jgi:hypothetical protein
MALADKMDDATRIVRVLEEKLAELDNKVAAYRAGMAAEFHRYQHDLLRTMPEEVSIRVEQTIAESMARFSALGPEFLAESPVNVRQMRPTKGSPPPSVAADTDLDEAPSTAATPDLSHEQEQGPLRGVFTQSYLPLLDHAPTPVAPSVQSSVGLLARDGDAGQQGGARRRSSVGIVGSGDGQVGGSTSGLGPASPVVEASTHTHIPMPVRPSSIRRATDDTTSSIASDRSDSSSKGRRSALRRSSSASKPQSPRRVRFDFDGGEVLPTTSPQTAEVEASSAIGARSALSHAPNTTNFPSSHSLLSDGEDDAPPPPKKVSSSQALRALSKAPLDMGTVWTVVNGQTDEDAQTPVTPVRGAPVLPTTISTDSVRSMDTVRAVSAASSTDTLRRAGSSGSVPEPGAPVPNDYQSDDDDSSSDGEFLSMGKAKKGSTNAPPSKLSLTTKSSPSNPANPSSTASAPQNPSQPKHGQPSTPQPLQARPSNSASAKQSPLPTPDNEDDMFDFEDAPGDRLKSRRT